MIWIGEEGREEGVFSEDIISMKMSKLQLRMMPM